MINASEFSNKMQNYISPHFISWLMENGFFNAPASTKYHGNVEGGLYQHSEAVMDVLVDFTNRGLISWEHPRSPYIIGMFHDLCKIDQYRHPEKGHIIDGSTVVDNSTWEYNPNTLYKGHGEKSVLLLSQFMSLTPEEVACITYHMGAFTDKEDWKYYSAAVEQYPTVLWTHTADMIASKIMKL